MAKPGPNKQPTAQLKLVGNPDAARRDRSEPKPPKGKPRCPDWLPDQAKRKWRSLAPRLIKQGTLTIVDVDAFSRYCALWARWRACEEFLARYGTTYPIYRVGKDGQLLKDEAGKPLLQRFGEHRQVAQANQLAQRLSALEAQFGLTPAARADLRGESDASADTPELRYFG